MKYVDETVNSIDTKKFFFPTLTSLKLRCMVQSMACPFSVKALFFLRGSKHVVLHLSWCRTSLRYDIQHVPGTAPAMS